MATSFMRGFTKRPAPTLQSQRPSAAVAAPAIMNTPPNPYNQSQLAELRKADQSLGNVAKSAYSPADLARIQQEQSKAMLQQPQQASGLKAFPQQPKKSIDTQASLVKTPTQQEYLARPDVMKENDNFLRQQESAARAMQKQQGVSVSPQAASQMADTGPKMPGMKKGGVVKKKPGYAKGGAVAKKTAASKYAKGGMAMPKASNCGASMKPQQKRK